MAASDHWHDSRNYLRRVVALPCAQSRIDGERVDPGGRDFNHHLSRCVEAVMVVPQLHLRGNSSVTSCHGHLFCSAQ